MTKTARFMSRREVAEMVGVTPRAVRDWARREVGPSYVCVGRSARYEVADVEQWIAENKRKGRSHA